MSGIFFGVNPVLKHVAQVMSDVCLHGRRVAGPSVHDSACLLPASLGSLRRGNTKGWKRGLGRNAVLCVLFLKINHLVKDI